MAEAQLKAVRDGKVLSPVRIRRTLTVFRLLAPILVPVIYRAATAARGMLDERRADRLGVPLSQVGQFPGTAVSCRLGSPARSDRCRVSPRRTPRTGRPNNSSLRCAGGSRIWRRRSPQRSPCLRRGDAQRTPPSRPTRRNRRRPDGPAGRALSSTPCPAASRASRFRRVQRRRFHRVACGHGSRHGVRHVPDGWDRGTARRPGRGMGAMVSASDRTADPAVTRCARARTAGQPPRAELLRAPRARRRDGSPGSRRPSCSWRTRGGGARCDSGCGVRTALRGTVLGDPWLRPDHPASVDGHARVRGTTVRPSTTPRVAHRRLDIAPRSPGRLRTLTA